MARHEAEALRAHDLASAGLRRDDEARLRRDEGDHRIANSLSLAASYLRMQRTRSKSLETRQALLAAEARLASIARFHAYLYKHGIAERIDFAHYLEKVVPEMCASIGLVCRLERDDAAPIEMPGAEAQELAMVVNELALNARKHAHGGCEGGSVTIRVGRAEDGVVRIVVTDRGAGLPPGFDPGKGSGLGLKIVTTVVGQLGGTLSAESDGGARFVVTVPAD